MTNQRARKRHFSVFIPSMAGYVCSVFGISKIIDKTADPTVMTFVLALIPAAFVFVWVWSHARYILEIDEFVRLLQIKSILYGLIAMMAMTTAWGFFEIYAGVPAVPIFYVLPGFYLCYGIASIIIGKRNNAGCQML